MVAINRDLKKIKQIIIHCSATDLPAYDNIEAIRKFHTDKGWADIGYHYFIDKKGHTFEGRPMSMVGAHCVGQNMTSIGICVSGNKIFYEEQFAALWFLVSNLIENFKIKRKDVLPHRFYNVNKTCPNFDLTKIWKYDEDTRAWYNAKKKFLDPKGD